MATAEQVKALIESHASNDETRFYAVALQVAAKAARQGHRQWAQALRDLVDRSRQHQKQLHVANLGTSNELVGILTSHQPTYRLEQASLSSEVASRLDRVLMEQRERQRLREYSLQPIHKLLLLGKPGTGKTFTASLLAAELKLPLHVIQLDGLITKYLGETAAKLRLVFETIQQSRGVYLFDEFDALGGERSAGGDVGEIRRVLNSFLQFLEMESSDSLIVAATNHPQLLDHALFRRFDMVIQYPLPSPQVIKHLLRSRLAVLNTEHVEWNQAVKACEGLSHGEIVRIADWTAKNAVLKEDLTVGTDAILMAAKDRRSSILRDAFND
ncbi:MAG: AAA family ATPase [Phycisphaeraceae bacterium]|nr:AAA family ATPase [Phycisphaeraceae bacterium]